MSGNEDIENPVEEESDGEEAHEEEAYREAESDDESSGEELDDAENDSDNAEDYGPPRGDLGKIPNDLWAADYRHSQYVAHKSNSVYLTPERNREPLCWNSDEFNRNSTPSRNDILSQTLERRRSENFLGSRPARGFHGGWRGTRILGAGGQGIVGLWEWRGRGPSPLPPNHQIVIKKVTGNDTLNDEWETMLKLGNRGTHTVGLIYPSSRAQGKRQRHDPVTGEMKGQKRLILEYCEGGDLDRFISKARERGALLPEEHLWRVFMCLAKGLSIMDHGTESPERDPTCDFTGICHFDLKPLNVLMGGRDANPSEHSETQICKIADFGLAVQLPISHKLRNRLRRRGTEGYYAPEQFSRRWQYNVPDQAENVGNYGTHTNIWQIGAIMYQLVTMGTPPFPNEINVLTLPGLTYGQKLNDERFLRYSEQLAMLIWRCLAEKPRNRPTLKELHAEIALALQADLGSDRLEESPDEPTEEDSPDEPTEEYSLDEPSEEDVAASDGPGEAFHFQVFRRDVPLRRVAAEARNAWFRADRACTVGDLKHTIRDEWLAAAWPEPGLGERKLWLLGDNREIPDDDDAMTLWEWGARDESRIYMRKVAHNYFVSSEQITFEGRERSKSSSVGA